MADPVLLAIETSQRHGGVAVRDAHGRGHEELLEAEARHDDDLVAAIDRLYARLGLTPAHTKAVGVSIGPGGFTGLRVAVSTAKVLAEALGAALIAVPTALVVAEAHSGPGPIVVALNAKDDTVWATRVKRERGTWHADSSGGLCDADGLPLDGAVALLGDRYLPPAVTEACHRSGIRVIEPVFSPLACLAVAWRLLGEGMTTDPLQLVPIYARPPSVTLPSTRPPTRPSTRPPTPPPTPPARDRYRA